MNDSSTNSCCEPVRTPAVPDDAAIGRTQKLVAAGGILGAIAASSCCIAPLVLFSLGISGAWIGNLTALAPYQPYFVRPLGAWTKERVAADVFVDTDAAPVRASRHAYRC